MGTTRGKRLAVRLLHKDDGAACWTQSLTMATVTVPSRQSGGPKTSGRSAKVILGTSTLRGWLSRTPNRWASFFFHKFASADIMAKPFDWGGGVSRASSLAPSYDWIFCDKLARQSHPGEVPMVIAARRCAWRCVLAALSIQGVPMLLLAGTSSTFVITHSVEKLFEQGIALKDMTTFLWDFVWWNPLRPILLDCTFDGHWGVLHHRWEGGLPLDRDACRKAARPRRWNRHRCASLLVTSGTLGSPPPRLRRSESSTRTISQRHTHRKFWVQGRGFDGFPPRSLRSYNASHACCTHVRVQFRLGSPAS